MSTALGIAQRVRGGQQTAVDAITLALLAAERVDARTNAFQSIDREGALAAAAVVDACVARGEDPGPLAGVPVALKDNLLQRGRPCTAGSRILQGYVGSYDATVVQRLAGAGAIVIGRTNMDEFGMGSSNETCAWGAVRHPVDPERVPGGSSGGSAVAVAGGAAPLALGSDTGGSVRLPAAWCGLVGVKPSYGRVSRSGLVAYASSTDQVGPMAATVADAAALLQAIAGPDPLDSTSANEPVPDWSTAPDAGVRGLRIGVPACWFGDELDGDVAVRVRAAIESLVGQGATLVPVELPAESLALACYYVLAPAEASANLARFDGMRYGARVPADGASGTFARTRSAGFGDEVKRRILVGTWVLSSGYIDAYYRSAQRVRRRMSAELDAVFDTVDALVSPTAPVVAPKLGSIPDPVAMYQLDRYTIPASLAGLPAISVPCGDVGGLPVGLQVIGRRFDEATCIRVAGAVEATTPPSPEA